ncbi:MAG: DUF1192 domain-containing protein, partial [Sphingomonadaceae bacterium]
FIPPTRPKSAARFIDSRTVSVNACPMDLDELFSKRPDDPLTILLKQDLDRLSVDELKLRVEALKGEIARAEAKIKSASDHRTSAEALFKR